MHRSTIDAWEHDHTFGLDRRKAGETRTLLVAVLTAVAMVVEVAAGMAFGSMALLADGVHMASHAVALGIAVAVYVYARRRAGNERFVFGTGKVNALGGYSSALLLALFSLGMAWESVARLVTPVPIAFNDAIFVACAGLVVNGVSVFILRDSHDHGHSHGDEGGTHTDQHGAAHEHDHDHDQDHGHGHEDFNLRGAFLHVFADALTSVLAIAALVVGKYAGAVWLDPVMGIVGAILVITWAWGLLRQSSRVLLDRWPPATLTKGIRDAIEGFRDTAVADLHVWSVGPALYAAELAVVTHDPAPPGRYKDLLRPFGLAHVTVEVNLCPGEKCA